MSGRGRGTGSSECSCSSSSRRGGLSWLLARDRERRLLAEDGSGDSSAQGDGTLLDPWNEHRPGRGPSQGAVPGRHVLAEPLSMSSEVVRSTESCPIADAVNESQELWRNAD